MQSLLAHYGYQQLSGNTPDAPLQRYKPKANKTTTRKENPAKPALQLQTLPSYKSKTWFYYKYCSEA
jgi:hypothetical protein